MWKRQGISKKMLCYMIHPHPGVNIAYLEIKVTRSALRADIVDDSNVGSCGHWVLASSISCPLDLQHQISISQGCRENY